jgi:putative cell wall-binding protein
VAIVVASVLTGPAQLATADDVPPVEIAPTELPRMSEYSAEQFSAEAATLPDALTTAVERDLGDSPEEYLARANAAADASDVVEALQTSGMNVLGSRLDGTALVVNVSNETDAATVQSLGATAEIGEPQVPDYSGARLDALADLVGGQGFQFLAQGYTYVCSVGFTGRYKPYPQAQFVTSGHCIEPDHAGDTYYYESRQTSAGSTPSRGSIIGAPLPSQYKFGGGSDAGAVAVSPSWTPKPTVSTWGGGGGRLTDGTPITITDLTTGVVGSPLCKSGRTTGWTCGEILVVNESYPVYNRAGTPQYVNLTLTDVCMLPGDSGAAALIGNNAFGLGTAGDWTGNCDRSSQPNAISAFFPMLTANGSPSVTTTLPEFELGVALASPTYVRPSFIGDTIQGTLANAGPRHRVIITIDSTSYSVTPGAGGQWSFTIPAALQSGAHTFTVGSKWGDVTTSPVVTDSYQLQARPTVERVDGATRYDVAVKISQRSYPATAPVVYVAAGSNYPDALSAAPAAVKQGGPLLLTPPDQLLPVVSAEISRLQPAKIVVVGGPASVNELVFAQLKALVPDATRLEGADRFAASRAVAAFAFGTTPKSYVATGLNFPDALSVSSAASSQRVPIVLVNGQVQSADSATLDLFRTMGTSQTTIAGGPNSVTTGVESSLRSLGAVNRLTGSDRFTASQAINRSAYSSSSTIYLATGYNYPDALAGGALAGKGNAPLYIVPTECVPRGVISDIAAMKATKIVLLGGVNSLNASVANLSACSW